MKKILLIFIIIVLVGTTSIFAFVFFKNQTNDRILAGRNEGIEKLRCPDCNVILIGIDTLRADHLSSYGYFRDTSPNIGKFAEKGVLFRNTFSASSKTTPSFMSILTSLYPTDHGILITINTEEDVVYTRINDSVKTLAEVMNGAGYKTEALVNTPQLALEFGFGDGFENYEFNDLLNNREKLLTFLKDNKDEKFFVFFHDNGPHDPYAPPEPYNTLYDYDYRGNITTVLPDISEIDTVEGGLKFEDAIKGKRIYGEEVKDYFWSNVDINNPRDIYHLQALYDGEIKYLDDFIRELQNVLLESGLSENTIIIFTADHGEEFLEHGDIIHNQVYNELLKVPFIISSPSIKENIEIKENVRTVDIMPTIMDMLDIRSGVPLRGKSLLPLIQDPTIKMNLPIIAMQYNKDTYEPIPLYQTIVKGSYKLIRNFTNNKSPYELYDTYSDEKELINLSDKKRNIALELYNYLQAQLSDTIYIYEPISLSLILDEGRRESLESLGY